MAKELRVNSATLERAGRITGERVSPRRARRRGAVPAAGDTPGAGVARSTARRRAEERLVGRGRETFLGILNENRFGSAVAKGTQRDLTEYVRLLGEHFAARLLAAGASSHVLDLGGGEGVAACQIAAGGVACSALDAERIRRLAARKESGRPKVTLVSFKTADRPAWPPEERFNPVVGELFEDVAIDRLAKLGPVDLVAELWGVLAYTDRPTDALARLHALMAAGGECYVRVGPRVFEYQSLTRVKQRSSLHASEVVGAKGERMTFPDWLKTVGGFDVSEDLDGHVLVLRKNKKPFAADTLRFDGYVREDLMPPGRLFRL